MGTRSLASHKTRHHKMRNGLVLSCFCVSATLANVGTGYSLFWEHADDFHKNFTSEINDTSIDTPSENGFWSNFMQPVKSMFNDIMSSLFGGANIGEVDGALRNGNASVVDTVMKNKSATQMDDGTQVLQSVHHILGKDGKVLGKIEHTSMMGTGPAPWEDGESGDDFENGASIESGDVESVTETGLEEIFVQAELADNLRSSFHADEKLN